EDAALLLLQQAIKRAYVERGKHAEGSYYHDLISKDIAVKENELRRYEEETSNKGTMDNIKQVYRQRVQEFLQDLCVIQDFSQASFQQKCNALELLGVEVFLAPDTREARALSGEDIVEEWITTSQAANLLGISRRTLQDYMSNGKLPVEVRGRNHWIYRDNLAAFSKDYPVLPKTMQRSQQFAQQFILSVSLDRDSETDQPSSLLNKIIECPFLGLI
ncbi:MAG TPA: helix-turn-helix domain-containing protein, partial [Ktedonobacteraceae bacterium]